MIAREEIGQFTAEQQDGFYRQLLVATPEEAVLYRTEAQVRPDLIDGEPLQVLRLTRLDHTGTIDVVPAQVKDYSLFLQRRLDYCPAVRQVGLHTLSELPLLIVSPTPEETRQPAIQVRTYTKVDVLAAIDDVRRGIQAERQAERRAEHVRRVETAYSHKPGLNPWVVHA
jgi:hypothetical protein